MRNMLKRLLILWWLPVVLSGANLVFVFHGAAGTANVYNADTMELLGSPTVGAGALRAFGVPDPANPTAYLKLYVVTSNSITVLNPTPPFTVRATVPLDSPGAAGPQAAGLSPDGRRLLVAAGNQVHVLNTTEAGDTIALSLPLPTAGAGVVFTPNSRRAYVMSAGSSVIRIIDLLPVVQLLSLTASLPIGVFPTAIGMPPNGARVYVAAPGAVYEIDRLSNNVSAPIPNSFFGGSGIVFDPDPPVATAVLNSGLSAPLLNLASRTVGTTPFSAAGLSISEIVMTGANRAFLLAGAPGRIFQGFLTAGGTASEVTSAQFGSNAIDIEGSPDGRFLFIAFSDQRVVRLDGFSSLPSGAATASLTPSGLSAVYLGGTPAAQLEIYGGNGQSGVAGATLRAPLAVRARTGNGQAAFGQTAIFSSDTADVSFSDTAPVTNLAGVAETFVTVPIATGVAVTATVNAGGFVSTQTFNLNGGGATTAPDGLRKVSGDRQIMVQGTQFPFDLVVRATSNGIPVPSLTLSATFPATVTCPALALTDVNGAASFTCTAGAVAAVTSAEISVTDPFGRSLPEPFRVTIVPTAADLPTQVVAEGESTLVGIVRTRFPDAIRVRALNAAGVGVPNVGVSFASQTDVSIDPALAITDGSGTATTSVTFGCFSGVGVIRATVLSQIQLSADIRFTAMRGPAAQLIKRQGDNQNGNPGRRLDGRGQALLVRLADQCGNGVSGRSVTWTVSPPEAATLESVFGATNDDGEASVLVRLGNRSGAFTVTANAGGFTAIFNLSVNIVASRLAATSGNNQSVIVGQQAGQPLAVEAQDANGVPAPGVEVTFRVASGSATVTPTRATTNALGRASATVLAGSALGAITVIAEAVGQSQTFTLETLGRVPAVVAAGFVNGASFRPGWAPGSLGVVFGAALMEGISGVVFADRAPFPTTLRGVRVAVDGVEVPIIAIANVGGREQINIQVPFNVPAPGTVTVVITNNGSSVTVSGVRVQPLAPGIFEIPATGLAAALHADFTLVTAANPARKGEIILVFLTGLGLTSPPVGTNVPGPVPPAIPVRQPVVGINGEGVEVLGWFYAPGLITAYQINFRIPENARSGLADLSVVVDNVASQDAKIPVQ